MQDPKDEGGSICSGWQPNRRREAEVKDEEERSSARAANRNPDPMANLDKPMDGDRKRKMPLVDAPQSKRAALDAKEESVRENESTGHNQQTPENGLPKGPSNQHKGKNTCDVCGKNWKFPSQLEQHMRTHTGEKPFVCEKCGRRFAQKYGSWQHQLTCGMRKDPKIYPFGCDQCDRRYNTLGNLRVHEKKSHPPIEEDAVWDPFGHSDTVDELLPPPEDQPPGPEQQHSTAEQETTDRGLLPIMPEVVPKDEPDLPLAENEELRRERDEAAGHKKELQLLSPSINFQEVPKTQLTASSVDPADNEIQDLRRELERVTEENANYKREIMQMKVKSFASDSRHRQLEAEIGKLRSESLELKNKLQDSESRRAWEMETGTQDLRKKLEKAMEENSKMQAENDELRKELEWSEEEKKRSMEECRQKEDERLELKKKMQLLAHSLASLEESERIARELRCEGEKAKGECRRIIMEQLADLSQEDQAEPKKDAS